LTRNEAARLPRALASLPAGARVLVVDAESSDATVALARAWGAQVDVRPWNGFVAARRYALERVDTPWTFMLDADEALDAELRGALTALDPPSDIDGYAVGRSTYLCGRPIGGAGWGDERLLRLFRTGGATLEAAPAAGGTADLHERWSVAGAVGALPGRLLHDSYPTLRAYREKFARYTSLEATGLPHSLPGLLRALTAAPARALWLYAGRGAWRDGWRGAFVAAASACYPVVARWKALRR
jgi:glycosyltransferase involved in cell wall biosynthesis